MRINTLILENFRNYAYEEITFGPGTNVIYGDNAQGKTNLLEAICMFSFGRSKRARSESELIHFGEKLFRLSLDFSDRHRDFKAVMSSSANGKKNIKINNVAITKLSQLMSYLNVVMFSPADLEIVQGAPSIRRRFLDEAISQLYPKYMSQLSDYHKTLDQKNGLLKQLRIKNSRSDPMLSVWNEQLSVLGADIYLKRKEFIQRLAAASADIQSEISREKLMIDYMPSINCDTSENNTTEIFYNKLEQNQTREIENGSSLLGIQRDDLKIKISEKEARLYGSQGQQRTAVLSLKLAQTEYINEERGEYPVLLLDDIMSELDINRRQFLSGRIKDKQVLITTTDAEGADVNQATKYYRISNGRLIE